MTLSEADKIVNTWGKYLEHCSGKMNFLFLLGGASCKIPESLLPYPKKVLEEALHKMDRYYWEQKNKRGMELMRETMLLLELYGNDEKALKEAGEAYLDDEKRNRIVANLKGWQKTWLTTQH